MYLTSIHAEPHWPNRSSPWLPCPICVYAKRMGLSGVGFCSCRVKKWKFGQRTNGHTLFSRRCPFSCLPVSSWHMLWHMLLVFSSYVEEDVLYIFSWFLSQLYSEDIHLSMRWDIYLPSHSGGRAGFLIWAFDRWLVWVTGLNLNVCHSLQDATVLLWDWWAAVLLLETLGYAVKRC